MPQEPPTIRPLQPEDIPACARLYRRAYGALGAGTPWDEATATRIVAEMQRLFPAECFVAERDGEVAGFVLCRSLAGLRLTIEEFAVAPEHQRQGLGSRLMDHVLDEARRRGLDSLELVAHRRTPAWRFYHRRGFRESGDYRLMTRTP